MRVEEKIDVAMGRKKADLVLKNARIVDVFAGEVIRGTIAIYEDTIVALEEVPSKKTIDLHGQYVAPGFMDAHVHIESAMVTLPEYAKAVVPRGTSAVVIDPHEIANVLGKEGIQYMIDSAKGLPLSVYVMLSSCVPASPFETSGAVLSAQDILPFFNEPSVLGLAEMMNFPGVLMNVPEVLEKIHIAGNRSIDGHAPGLSGQALSAYISAGIRSDHECTTAEEALEKVRKGMMVFIREGTAAKNLDALLPLVKPENSTRFAFCTDDRHPQDLCTQGHIDDIVRKAIQKGLDPVLAIRLASYNPAIHFGFHDQGAIAPGFKANFLVMDNLKDISIQQVYHHGKLVAENGQCVDFPFSPRNMPRSLGAFHVKPFDLTSLQIPMAKGKIRVIQLIPGQIVTQTRIEDPKESHGKVVSDPSRDILKMVVVERHHATGNIGLGFVSGFGFQKGAIASSVAHDAHNIVAVGVEDDDIFFAIQEVIRLQGGLVVVHNQKTVSALSLPIAGLMSNQSLKSVAEKVEMLKKSAAELGGKLEDPFMQLSFLALSVIPELKLTDKGLVDGNKFDFVPLFVE